MNTSPETADLAAALAAAQAELPVVPKRHVARVPTRSGGEYAYKYADLEDVVSASRPVLATHGLAVMQMTGYADGHDTLTTRVMHRSGQWAESTMRLFLATGEPPGAGLGAHLRPPLRLVRGARHRRRRGRRRPGRGAGRHQHPERACVRCSQAASPSCTARAMVAGRRLPERGRGPPGHRRAQCRHAPGARGRAACGTGLAHRAQLPAQAPRRGPGRARRRGGERARPCARARARRRALRGGRRDG